eukprot:1692577-Alexandrium_andersonii.AAC.1
MPRQAARSMSMALRVAISLCVFRYSICATDLQCCGGGPCGWSEERPVKLLDMITQLLQGVPSHRSPPVEILKTRLIAIFRPTCVKMFSEGALSISKHPKGPM